MAITTNSDNPLHQYRTYSYHHVLLACVDNSIIEESFTNMPFDQLLPTSQAIGNVTERCVPRYVNNDKNKPYIVLINTQVDVEFLIKSLTFKVIPAPPPNPVDGLKDYQYARSAFVYGGSVVIEEPFGIRFGDMMAQVSAKLKAPPERIVFVLKTAFFGFTDIGVTTIQQIKPIALCFLKIDATFTAAGGHYELEFVPYSNGFANRKEISKVGSAVKFKTGSTIEQAMTKFASILNTEQKKLNESEPKLQAVEYDIVVDDKFKNFTVTDSVNAPNLDKDQVQFVGSANDSITEMIEKVMMLSKDMRNLFTRPSQTPTNTESNPNTERFTFKIYSEVLNTPNLFKVVFHVYPVKAIIAPVPTEDDRKDPTILTKKRKDAIAKFISDAKADNNYLEYNYIYSGKNVDILEFEMRLNLWTTFQAYYMEEQHFAAKSQVHNNTGAGYTKVGKDNYITDAPDNSPKLLTMAQQPPNTILAIKDNLEFQKFDDYLTRTVSLSTGGTYLNLTVAGDPRLYAGYLQSPFDTSGKLKKTKDLAGQPSAIMNNWAQVPALVKINVFMPNPPSTTIQDQTVQQAFGAPFWFDGLYQIMSITNMFTDDGKFTQQLELLPVSGDYNVADLTEFGKSEGDSADAGTSAAAQAATTPGTKVQQKESPVVDYDDAQKKCLKLAAIVAARNSMPVVTLQGILLADSNACDPAYMDKQVSTTADVVNGATKLSVQRVLTYLKGDPSAVAAISKRSGVDVTNSPNSIRYLLLRNEDFNLDMTAKIWSQDKALIQRIFAQRTNQGRSAPFVPPEKADVNAQATIAHHNMTAGGGTSTAQDDVGFNTAAGAPIPAQSGYIQEINANKDNIIQFNATNPVT